MHIRVPKEHKRLYEREAADAGLDLCDYIALVLARAHHLPEPGYIRPRHREEALPLGA